MTKQDAPTTTDGRAEFEAWARKQPFIKDCQRHRDGGYGHWDTQKAWLTWQAARASSAAAQWISPEQRAKLERFLNAAAGEGYVLDDVDAADLYVAIFPAEYAAALGLMADAPEPPAGPTVHELIEALHQAEAGLEVAVAHKPQTTDFVPSHVLALGIVKDVLARCPAPPAKPADTAEASNG